MQPISTSIAPDTGIGDGSVAKVQNILYKAKLFGEIMMRVEGMREDRGR